MRIAVVFFFIFFYAQLHGQNNADRVADSTAAKDLERKELKTEPQSASPSVMQKETDKKTKSATRDAKVFDGYSQPASNAEAAGGAAGDLGTGQLMEDAEEVQSTIYLQNSSNFEYTKARATEQRVQRSPSAVQQQEMNEAVDYFEQNAPASFEYNYYRYAAGNYNIALEDNLAEAERIRPDNADVHVQYAAYHMISGNTQEALGYMGRLIESGRLTEGVLDYSEDILRSTPENGTLITHGFDDTYGSYYVQNAQGVRQDVELVSLDFMQSEDYREGLTDKGFVLPSSNQVDVNYFTQFCSLNDGKNIAVSMTTPKEYFQPIMPNLYATGLVFEYHPNPYNNFARNVRLWETELTKTTVLNPVDDKARKLSSNYLPMLFALRKVYEEQGNKAKVGELDSTIDKIGAQSDKYEKVQSLKKAY